MKKLFILIIACYALSATCFAECKDNTIEVIFNKLGATYQKNEQGWVVCKIKKVNDSITCDVLIEIVDIDGKAAGYREEYTLSSPFERYYHVPFSLENLGYYYIKVSLFHQDTLVCSCQEGFGVIPDVTLKGKDYDSPFGVGAHYTRYDDWRVGEIQQALGIAWVRDNAGWKKMNYIGHDPFIDYLDKYNICWLPILDYVDANNGWLDENGIWRWDSDVSKIKQYISQNKGKINIYESQNEPSNFAGWNKRWQHPQNQKWRPQGWGIPFTDLVKQMYDSVKTVDKNIQLIWPGEEEWIEYFTDNREGVAERIDFTSIHPYVLWNKYPETAIHAGNYYKEQKAMLKKRNVPTEIWVTETGWTTYMPDGVKRHFPYVTELEQAQFLVRTYLLQLYNGVGKIFWYELVEEPFGLYHPESSFGLLRYNSMLTVKPAAVAYANMVNIYRHLTPIGKYIPKDDKTYGLVYKDPAEKGKLVLSIWRESDSKEEMIPVEHTKALTGTDIFGRKVEIPIVEGRAHLPLTMSVLTVRGFDVRDLKSLYKED